MLAQELRNRIRNQIEGGPPKKYCVIACHVLWRELCHYGAQSPRVLDFHFLEQGLHDTPEKLRTELQAAIDARDAGGYDALLLGYGLCSNGLQGIEARTTPLVCIRAHDCITFLLGSKERYQEYFNTHPGTFWYSAGWIDDCVMPGKERYDAALATYTELYGEENAKYLMEATETWISNYNNAAYIEMDTGLPGDPAREYTREAAASLGWSFTDIPGDPRLIQAFLAGEWNEEDFLIVPPGHTIAPSFDDRILEARPPAP